MGWFTDLHPVAQAVVATLGTWALTAVGAASVLFFRTIDRRVMDSMLGFASGVMIAASCWSLLVPSIEMAESLGLVPWWPAFIGFIGGGLFIGVIDRILPHLHADRPREDAEGIQTGWRRTILLVLAITLHNIPEGLAVGVAFGAVAAGLPSATLGGAVALAIGIGLQNLPEGAAVAVPLRREGLSRRKSFWYGQLSGAVEPVAGFIGAVTVMSILPALPYALAFAAGAMIYVVVEELIPESQAGPHSDYATVGALGGFALMMALDVALG
jgi:ZIP family zinc transporter